MVGEQPSRDPGEAAVSQQRRWVTWRWGRFSGFDDAKFIDVRTAEEASLTDADTWYSLEKARLFRQFHHDLVDGIGLVLRTRTPCFCVTLHGALSEYDDILPWAEETLEVSDTYTEINELLGGLTMLFRGTPSSIETGRATVTRDGVVPISGHNRHGSLDDVAEFDPELTSILQSDET